MVRSFEKLVKEGENMSKRDWDIVTSYIDKAGTSDKVVSFNKVQDSVQVKNQGNVNLIYSIGTKSGTLAPNGTITVSENLSSFTVKASSGICSFELRATEAGTETEETPSSVPGDVGVKLTQLESQMAQNAKKAFFSVTDFGAKGDYNPDTDTGTDDTAAFQNALNALQPYQTLFIPKGIYKITNTLTTPNKAVFIKGDGLHSIIFGNVGVDKDVLFIPKDPLGLNTCNLKDFAILGKASAGRAGLYAEALGFSDIDIYIGGGFQYMMYMYKNDALKGGLECSTIKLTTIQSNAKFNFSFVPPKPVHGFYLDGYANECKFHMELQGLTGYGLYMKGSYSSGNNSTIVGSFQAITLNAIKIEGTSFKTKLHDIHCEVVGSPAISISGLKHGEITNCSGSLTLTNSIDTKVSHNNGEVTISSDCVDCEVSGGVSDGLPLANTSKTFYSDSYRTYNSGSGSWANTGYNKNSVINTVLNGNMERFVTNIAKQLWGAKGEYLATQCGVGLADTTKTSHSDFCAKIEVRTGSGNMVYFDIFQPGELAGYEGNVVWFSAKVKIIQGKSHVQLSPSNAGLAYTREILATNFPTVENGFIRVMLLAKVTADMVTNGVQGRFHNPAVNSVDSSIYVSEVMGGLGTNIPHEYINPSTFGGVRKKCVVEKGLLRTYMDALPTTGGDPLFDMNWVKGDYIVNKNPVVSGTTPNRIVTKGWIRLTSGKTHTLYTDWFPDNVKE